MRLSTHRVHSYAPTKPDLKIPALMVGLVMFVCSLLFLSLLIWPHSPLHRGIFAKMPFTITISFPAAQSPTLPAPTIALFMVTASTPSATSTPVATPTPNIPQRKSGDGMAMVQVQDFWMDTTEVTNAMYAQCVTAGRCLPPGANRPQFQQNYYSNPKYASYPVVYVNGNQAMAYCIWQGKTLPTHAQWLAAAGPGPYPWGKDLPTEKNANYCLSNCGLLGDDISNGQGFTKPVGSYPQGMSPFGVLDMAGNVYEWQFQGGVFSYGGSAWSTPLNFLDISTPPIQTPRDANVLRSDLGFRCVQ